jgi:hypothetical protein
MWRLLPPGLELEPESDLVEAGAGNAACPAMF